MIRLGLPREGRPSAEMVLWAGGRPALAALFYNRGYKTREQVDSILSPLARPEPDLESYPPLAAAAALVNGALAKGEKIAVYGDYDVDGITATTVLVTALGRLGAEPLWHIPDRFSEGYGLDSGRIETLARAGVKLIITCDCGISNEEEILLAQSLGVAVLVTDHHTPPLQLPPAPVLNFKLLPPEHPSRDLPGVGTAYVLARALLKNQGLPAEDLLDLVALGIIADVVPLLGHGRQLYARGLPLLQRGERPGLAALFAAAGLTPELVDEEMLSFQIAPRLNAAGRLASGKLGVELLLSQDEARAQDLARELNVLNLRRKELGAAILAALADKEGPVVAWDPGWHQGVIGIAAGQLAARNLAPALLMTEGRDGQIVGSARSPAGVNIYSILSRCREHLLRFGGHPAAAGFSLERAKLEAFCQGVGRALAEALAGWRPPELAVDLVLDPGDVNMALAQELAALAPCGEGNPPPLLYCPGLTVKSKRPAGSGHILTLGDRGHSFAAGLWGGSPAPEPGGGIGAVFTLSRDYYRGQQGAMASIKAWWPGESPPVLLNKSLAYLDRRGLSWEETVAVYPRGGVYREGLGWQERPGATRTGLEPASVLLFLTAPPSPAVFRQVLALVEPETVVLAYSPPAKEDFLGVFLGAVKYICREQGGIVSLAFLAAALGHREETLVAALRLLAESGILHHELLEGKLVLSPGESAKLKTGPRRQILLRLLEETAAYRAWLQEAPVAEIKKSGP